jgi:hypothetical protein
MSEEVKQEGTFKMKKKTPKKLVAEKEVTKVDLTKKEIPKVDLTKTEKDAIPAQETNDSNVVIEKSQDGEDGKTVVEEVRPTEETVESPLQLVEDEINETENINDDTVKKEDSETKQKKEEVQKLPRQEEKTKQELPENINKLIEFMKETGGDIQDYARLNADYSNVDDYTLLREYYKSTKPHLDTEDVNILLEEFDYDKELEDTKDIRKKQIAYKEEVAKAKNFLESTKQKYYEEIKLKPSLNSEQQKATDFFNRYQEEEKHKDNVRKEFIDTTNNYFANEFKGFEFNLADKKFRYGIKDANNVAESQQDLSKFVDTYFDKDGKMNDAAGYHKALFAARNADTIANHFYEQGRTDAIKQQVAKSKNITTEPRQTASGEVFINGLKVKAISGLDSSKLKIKTKKFKN